MRWVWPDYRGHLFSEIIIQFKAKVEMGCNIRIPWLEGFFFFFLAWIGSCSFSKDLMNNLWNQGRKNNQISCLFKSFFYKETWSSKLWTRSSRDWNFNIAEYVIELFYKMKYNYLPKFSTHLTKFDGKVNDFISHYIFLALGEKEMIQT